MVFFVESDFGYSPVVRKRQPATGMRRKVLKQFAPPPDDTPELLESRPIVKAFYLGSMDSQQKIDKVVKNRRCKLAGGSMRDRTLTFEQLWVLQSPTLAPKLQHCRPKRHILALRTLIASSARSFRTPATSTRLKEPQRRLHYPTHSPITAATHSLLKRLLPTDISYCVSSSKRNRPPEASSLQQID